jgi:hypothetical protein
MSFCLVGYFPKKIARATGAMACPGVTEIWSVSHCMSPGPDNWIQCWRHNALGLFDTPALAQSVVPAGLADAFQIVGYRLWLEAFGAGPRLPALEGTAELPPAAGFDVVGYDAVSSSRACEFECSPLSCNGAASDMDVNDRCLFTSAGDAAAAARTFAAGLFEPGPYYVVEVLAAGEARGPDA